MKKLIVLIVLALAVVAQSQIETGIRYDDKVFLHGFPLYQDRAAISPFTSFSIAGLDMAVDGVVPIEEENEEDRRLDISVSRETEWGTFNYIYYNYPDSSSHDAQADPTHFHEFSWQLKLPLELPVDLSYQLCYITPFNQDTGEDTGFLHILKLDEQISGVDIFGELVYNDGWEPMGLEVDNDFSHLLLGASVDLDLGQVIVRPQVYHQMTFDDGITDDKNQTWYGMSVVYQY